MYTCDICGTDVLDTDNLIRANYRDEKGDRFYGNCDILVCSDCSEEHEEELYYVEETD